MRKDSTKDSAKDGLVVVCPVCGKRSVDRIKLRVGDSKCLTCGAALEHFVGSGVTLAVDMDCPRSSKELSYIEEHLTRVMQMLRESTAEYGPKQK